MHLNKPKLKPWILWPSLFILALEGCVHVPDITPCAALPRISIGAGCAHTQTANAFKLSTTEILDLLDTHDNDRSCVPVGQVLTADGKQIADPGLPACADDQSRGVITSLPARGASIILSPQDWTAFSSTLQEACRELGDRCDYSGTVAAIERVSAQIRLPGR